MIFAPIGCICSKPRDDVSSDIGSRRGWRPSCAVRCGPRSSPARFSPACGRSARGRSSSSRGLKLRRSTRPRGCARTATSTSSCPTPRVWSGVFERAGFGGVGPPMDWDALHHVQRLASPDVLASIEVHRRPKWVPGATAPTVAELLRDAVPSATGVNGLLAPSRGHHAVLLAAHAWAERPLERLGDLVDVAAMLASEPEDSEVLARRCGIQRVWRATLSAIEALLVRDRRTWATSSWARHLPQVRERTVLEAHLARLLEPFASLPPRQAPAGLLRGLRQTLVPSRGEGWPEKLDRSRKAIRSARAPLSEHRAALQRESEDGS